MNPSLTAFAGFPCPNPTGYHSPSRRSASPGMPRQPPAGCGIRLCPCCDRDINTDSPAPLTVIRADPRLNLALLLAQSGASYAMDLDPGQGRIWNIRRGPGCPQPLPYLEPSQFYITGIRDYGGTGKPGKFWNQHPYRVRNMNISFYSVHMGWWNDSEEPFEGQWNRINSGLSLFSREQSVAHGDFNSRPT